MQKFATTRGAKEFLISRIIAEAQRESIPLSEVETRMLYFSETAGTLPDITAVNESFERDYDQAEYEQKIGALIRNFRIRARKENQNEFDLWNDAVCTIRSEDHYLLVLIDGPDGTGANSRVRLQKLWLIGLAITGVLLALMEAIVHRSTLRIPVRIPSQETIR